MKRFLILLASLLFAWAAVWLAEQFLHGGLSARARPTAAEIAVARRVRHMAIPGDARAMANPVATSPQVVHAGMLHFADHCAVCHANDGSGDTMIGRGLYPKPPDLRQARTQNLSDGELFWIIENGVRFTGMPAFGTPDHALESWHLVHFIRHLPQLAPEERLEMERNNPKSAADRAEEQEEEKFLGGELSVPKQETNHQP